MFNISIYISISLTLATVNIQETWLPPLQISALLQSLRETTSIDLAFSTCKVKACDHYPSCSEIYKDDKVHVEKSMKLKMSRHL